MSNPSGLAKLVVTDFITEPLDLERRVLDGVATVYALEATGEADLVSSVADGSAPQPR